MRCLGTQDVATSTMSVRLRLADSVESDPSGKFTIDWSDYKAEGRNYEVHENARLEKIAADRGIISGQEASEDAVTMILKSRLKPEGQPAPSS